MGGWVDSGTSLEIVEKRKIAMENAVFWDVMSYDSCKN
jgi:hypothetical protein